MEETQTVVAGSEPAAPAVVEPTEPVAPAAPPETPEEPGSEPAGKEHQKLRQRAQRAEAEAAYYRGLAEGKGTPAQAAEPVKPQIPQFPKQAPTLDQFEKIEDYERARSAFDREVIKWEIHHEQEAERRTSELRTIETTYQDRVRKAQTKYPDYGEVASRRDVAINPLMAHLIKKSDLGPDMAYFFGKNPEEAHRIAYMNDPTDVILEMTRLEVKLQSQQQAQPQHITQAPEPIRQVGSKGSVTSFDYDKSDINEFMKRRNTEAPPRRR